MKEAPTLEETEVIPQMMLSWGVGPELLVRTEVIIGRWRRLSQWQMRLRSGKKQMGVGYRARGR